jgi:hypothetical protein
MKMWLDEQNKPTSEKEFRILLMNFDEEFTNSTTTTTTTTPVTKTDSQILELLVTTL